MERDRANELAHHVVWNEETTYMHGLLLDLQKADSAAEMCGCPDCRKYPDRLHDRIHTELLRTKEPEGVRSYHTSDKS